MHFRIVAWSHHSQYGDHRCNHYGNNMWGATIMVITTKHARMPAHLPHASCPTLHVANTYVSDTTFCFAGGMHTVEGLCRHPWPDSSVAKNKWTTITQTNQTRNQVLLRLWNMTASRYELQTSVAQPQTVYSRIDHGMKDKQQAVYVHMYMTPLFYNKDCCSMYSNSLRCCIVPAIYLFCQLFTQCFVAGPVEGSFISPACAILSRL